MTPLKTPCETKFEVDAVVAAVVLFAAEAQSELTSAQALDASVVAEFRMSVESFLMSSHAP